MTDDANVDPAREEPWPFETVTPEQFYALPLAQRLAVQKMVRDMADGKTADH